MFEVSKLLTLDAYLKPSEVGSAAVVGGVSLVRDMLRSRRLRTVGFSLKLSSSLFSLYSSRSSFYLFSFSAFVSKLSLVCFLFKHSLLLLLYILDVCSDVSIATGSHFSSVLLIKAGGS